MQHISSQRVRYGIAFAIGALCGLGYFGFAVQANAETLSGVSIASNGQTIVHGARVVSVSGNELVAYTAWGDAKMTWHVVINGMTKLMPRGDKETLAQFVQPGDRVGFTGTMDANVSAPTIRAAGLRNESVVQSSAVLTGSLLSSQTGSLVMITPQGTSTIRIGTGTIMTKDGNTADEEDFKPGSEIKAFGTFNANSRELEAQRVISVSVPSAVSTPTARTAVAGRTGLFENVVSWLSFRGGSLSVR